MNHSLTYFQYGPSSLAARAIVLALVVTAHLAVLSVWQTQGNAQVVTTNQMSVSFIMAAQEQQPTRPPRQTAPPPPRTAPIPLPLQVAEPATIAAAEQAAAAKVDAVMPAPVVADIEPDYKAAYLNNPPPAYPMVARRNGLQGRVTLSVEVLANGSCGQINIHKSSGYAMLDNAALQTVKNWRFAPARQAGQTVDKWFMVPIQFSLKENAA